MRRLCLGGCSLFARYGQGGRAEEAAAHEAGAGGGGGRDAEDGVDLPDHLHSRPSIVIFA